MQLQEATLKENLLASPALGLSGSSSVRVSSKILFTTCEATSGSKIRGSWFVVPLVPIPPDGVLVMPTTLPIEPPALWDLPMQGLVGLNSDSLTNLCVLAVR